MTTTADTAARIVTGPAETKRFGRTLAIDLGAPQQGLTAGRNTSIPRASLVVTTAARIIIQLGKDGGKLDTIAVHGTPDDPALHPDLREITENVRALRDKHMSRAKLRVFTKVRDLNSYDMRATLAMYDRVHLQFDWGTAKFFAELTKEKSTGFAQLVKNAGSFDHLVLETNFFRGPKDNSTDADVKNMIKKLEEIKPQEVHVIAGPGSAESVAKVKPVTPKRRDAIADELAEKTGLNVSVHELESLPGA